MTKYNPTQRLLKKKTRAPKRPAGRPRTNSKSVHLHFDPETFEFLAKTARRNGHRSVPAFVSAICNGLYKGDQTLREIERQKRERRQIELAKIGYMLEEDLEEG